MKRLACLVLLASACSDDIVYSSDDPWADPTDYPEIGNGLVMVTNSGDDTLSWIALGADGKPTQVVFEEGVGFYPVEREGPHHGAVLPDGSAYFVGLSNFVPGSGSGPHGSHGTGNVDGYLLKYDMATHRPVGERRVDRSPGDVRITSDGRWVLQSHFDLLRIMEHVIDPTKPIDSKLAIIDAATMVEVGMVDVCPAAHGIAIAADDSEAYVSCYGSDALAVVTLDEDAGFPVEVFAVGEGVNDPTAPNYGPYAAAVQPTADSSVKGPVWVSALESGELRVFDPETRTFDDPIDVGGAPLFGDFNADGTRFYVAVQGSNQLAIIDTTTRTALTPIALPNEECLNPHGVLALPNEETVLVVCEGDHIENGTVGVVQLVGELGGLDGSIEVGVFPDDLILVTP